MIKTASEIRELEAKAAAIAQQAFEIKDAATKKGDDLAPDMKSKELERFRAKYQEAEDLYAELDEAKSDLDKQIQLDNWRKASGENVETKADVAENIFQKIGDEFAGKSVSQMKMLGDVHAKGADQFLDLKAAFTTAAGWDPFVVRQPGVTLSPQRPIQVVDTIPMFTTDQHSVKFMRETTFTNAAATKAENAALAESTLVTTEVTVPIEKIGTFLPVTEEQLEDEGQVRGYLTGRLGFMVRQILDNQIVNGNGTTPNLEGLLDSGLQTQAKGGNSISDAILKARTKVRQADSGSGGAAVPDVLYISPATFEKLALEKTADGQYIYGGPSQLAQSQRVWGLQVVETETLSTTAIVLDRNYVGLAMRKGVTISVSDSHSDYFIYNKLAMRAHVRAALVRYRPTAICSVTGV